MTLLIDQVVNRIMIVKRRRRIMMMVNDVCCWFDKVSSSSFTDLVVVKETFEVYMIRTKSD